MSNIVIYDHALLQWLERVKGFDIVGLRNELLAIVGPALTAGARSLRRDGFIYIMDGGKLITVKLKGSKQSHHREKEKAHANVS